MVDMSTMPLKPTWLYKKNICYIQSYSPSSRRSERETRGGHVHHMSTIAQQTRKERHMTRNRQSAKQAGSATERAVADYLAAALDDDRIDRRVKRGSADRGDIGGLRIHGRRLVLEVKDCAKVDLPGFTAQAHLEANNDDALCGVVCAKRRGTTDPGRYWVHMTLDDLLALMTGERHGHRAEDFDNE